MRKDRDRSIGERAVAALAIAALIACVWRTAAAGPEAGTWLAIAALVANLILARRPAATHRAAPLTSDAATGLLTRAAFVEACGGLTRRGRRTAMLLIAFEASEEAAIAAAAVVVRRALPGGGVAGRLDDRTIVLLVTFDPAHPQNVDALARHLHGALAQPLGGYRVRAAIGIAEMDREATVGRLIDRARAAAAAARHRPHRHDAALERATRTRATAVAALADGIADRTVAPHYRPRRGPASDAPDVLAVVADADAAAFADAGLAPELTAALMARAFAEARDWAVTLSFALAPDELADPWLAQKIVRQLVEAGFPAHRLEIAAPAHAIGEVARATLRSLANQGARIALTGVGGAGSLVETVAALGAVRLEADPAIAARPALLAAIGAIGVPVAMPDEAEPLAIGAVRRLLAEQGLLPAARVTAPPPRSAAPDSAHVGAMDLRAGRA